MGEPAVQHRDLDAWSGTALMEIDTYRYRSSNHTVGPVRPLTPHLITLLIVVLPPDLSTDKNTRLSVGTASAGNIR